MLNPIEKGSQWKAFLSSNVSPHWIQLYYDDSKWNTYRYNASSSIASRRPVYFRMPFTVDSLFTAYELQVQYQYGIIVYLNGNEVFRDNMADDSMECVRFYSSLNYHGFIRSAADFSSMNILAIEQHPYLQIPLVISHDAYLAGYFSTLQSDCYVYPYEVAPSSSANPVIDMNILTFWDTYTENPSVQIAFPRIRAAVNTIEFYSTARCDGLPNYIEYTETDSSEKPVSVPVGPYQRNEYIQVTLPVEHRAVRGFTLKLFASSLVSISEMRIGVCRLPSLPFFRFTVSSVSLYLGVPIVPLLPSPLDARMCTLLQRLPSGLLLTSGCHIEGTPTELGVFEVTVAVRDPPLQPGTIRIIVSNCLGVLLRLERHWGVHFFTGESVLVRDRMHVLYHEDTSSFQKALGNAVRFICTNSTQLEITMAHTEFLYWWYHSSLQIDWYSPEYAFPLFHSRYDSRIGSGIHQTVSLELVSDMQSSWYQWYGELPPRWMDKTVVSWTPHSHPLWSCRDRQINAFKRFFNVAEVGGVSALEFHVAYGGGIVIAINEVILYSFNVELPLTNRSEPKKWNPQTRFHTIVLPSYRKLPRDNSSFIHLPVLRTGVNTVSIAVVRFANETACPSFQCLFRLRRGEDVDISPLVREVTSSEPNGSDVLGKEGDTEIEGDGHTWKSFTMDFGSGCEVSVNALVVASREDRKNALPPFVLFGQHDDDDDDWNEILDVSPEGPLSQKNSQHYWVARPGSYRKYHLVTRVSESSPWYLTSLSLRLESIPTFIPELTYALTGPIVGQSFYCIPPETPWYNNFTVVVMNPQLHVDVENGCIFGTINSTGTLTIKVAATSVENRLSTFHQMLEICSPEPDALFATLRIVTGGNPLASNWTLYSHIPPSYLQRNCSFAELLRVATFHSSNTIDYQPYSTYSHSVPLSGYAHMIVFPSESAPWDPSAMYHISYKDFLITSGGFHTESERYVLFTTLFVVDQASSQWRLYDWVSPVPSTWLNLSFDDSGWVRGPLTEYLLPFNVVTTYARIFFDWSPLTVYRLLQGKVYYEGGLKIYVNGHEVARFNLEEGATASTYALQHHDYDSPSRFHLSMLLDNCLTGRNLLAFEMHRPREESTTPDRFLRFDCMMRAVFSKLTYATDSVTDIRSTAIPSERNPLSFSLSDDYTLYGYAVIEHKSFIEWSPENLDKSRINTFLIASGGIDRIAFSLFGTIDGLHWDEVLSLDRLSLPPSKRVPISLFQGIRGYARYRVEFNDETVRQEVLRINVVAFGLMETDGPACPAVNEFPATFNQNISPGACPCGYVGYAYRRCVDGRLGAVMLDRCVEMKPSIFYYAEHVIWVGSRFAWTPEVDRKQVYFELLDPLPQGLTLNVTSGVVSGVLDEELVESVRIHVANSQGAKGTTLHLVARRAMCREDGDWKEVPVVKRVTVTILCPSDRMIGIQTRDCVQDDQGGAWGTVRSFCVSRRLLCLLLIIASVLVSLGLLFLRNVLFSSRRRLATIPATIQENGLDCSVC